MCVLIERSVANGNVFQGFERVYLLTNGIKMFLNEIVVSWSVYCFSVVLVCKGFRGSGYISA